MFITARNYDSIYFVIKFNTNIYDPKQFTRQITSISQSKCEFVNVISVVVADIHQRTQTGKMLYDFLVMVSWRNLTKNNFAVCVS